MTVEMSSKDSKLVSLQSLLNYSKSLHLQKCVLTILELNWNQSFRDQKTKLNICHHMLMSSTQLQSRSFDVVERTRMSTKCPKMKKCMCKVCKTSVFHCQICKFVMLLLPSSLWLLISSLFFHPVGPATAW